MGQMPPPDDKPSVVAFQATPQLKEALRKFGGEGKSISKIARDICVAFLVANGFLANADEAAVCPGIPQSFFIGTPEEKAAVLEKMRAKTTLMNKRNAEVGQARRPRGKIKPKPQTIVIAPAQIDETNRAFTREQLKEIIAEQVKAALKNKGI